MKPIVSQRCLTRIVADDDVTLEIAQMQTVMTRIQGALRDIPDAQRGYVANALLNLAVSKMVNEEGGTGWVTRDAMTGKIGPRAI